MQSALSKLEAAIAEVPWSSLHHAYGSASDVPTLLRELASGHRGRQRGAIHAFYGNIWHQGTIYPASAPAAHCLLALLRQSHDLAQNDAEELFEKVLTLLLHLASGYGEAGPQLQEECRRTLARDIDLYQQLLCHAQPRIRLRTAHLLGLLDSPLASEQLVRGFADESAPEVRAARALALGQHMGAHHRLATCLGDERDPSVALAILLAYARTSPNDEREATAELAELLELRHTLARLQSWQDPELEQALEPLPRYICCVETPVRYRLLVPFAQLLSDLESDDSWGVSLAWDVLVSAFEPNTAHLDISQCHPDQRRILRHLTQANAAWTTGEFSGFLAEHLGLDQPDIRSYLASSLNCDIDELSLPVADATDEYDEDIEAPGVYIPALDEAYAGPYSDAQQTLAHRTTQILYSHGFHESRAWHKAFVQLANAGLTMHPAAIGRQFGSLRNVTVGLDFHAPKTCKQFADTTNYQLGETYLKLVYTDQEDHPELTLRVGLAATDDETLGQLAAAIATSVDEQTLAGVLAALEPVAAPLLVEFGNSHFAVLTRIFRN